MADQPTHVSLTRVCTHCLAPCQLGKRACWRCGREEWSWLSDLGFTDKESNDG